MTEQKSAKEIALLAVKALDHKLGADIRLLRIGDISSLADYFVIATGTSNTHVHALSDEVSYQLREAGIEERRTEGYDSNSWVLIDYGAVVVHVFQEKAREFYDLERLWKDAEEVDLTEFLQEDTN